MLFLLSPAKSLDYNRAAPKGLTLTDPLFMKESEQLIDQLKKLSKEQIAELMSLSDSLASLNQERYQKWTVKPDLKDVSQAILAFDGDVYAGLNASNLNINDLNWAQNHLLILSGLYGVLRPLDALQAYRLEMGTPFLNSKGRNLYEFWDQKITQAINENLNNINKNKNKNEDNIIVNLASQEYFKSVQKKNLIQNTQLIDCIFEDYKSGDYKVISFFAKRARGLMMRFAILNRVSQINELKNFDLDGYRFSEEVSKSNRLVFRRKMV